MKLFLLIFALKSALGLQLSYNVIEQTGKFCPGRDSCERGRNSRGPIENDWKKRNCFCDNACAMYGDCCIDANAYVQAEQQVNHQSFECANLKQYGDVYVKNKCLTTYSNPNIRAKCETPGLTNNDPFGTTPVTSMESGFTYKNYYCSVCNLDSEDVRFWRPRLECPTLTSYANRFKNITSEFVKENLVLSEDGQRWGINIDTSGVRVFHECTVDPAVPDTLTHLIRACTGKNTIDSCPPNYSKNATIDELCSSYTAMVFEPNLAYRNVHCAICNNASMDKLICLNLGPFGRFNWQQNFNTFSFAVLFDIGGNISDSVGFVKAPTEKCNDFELFDPFFKKCRNVICGQEGMEFIDGKCRETEKSQLTSTTSTRSTTTTTVTTTRFAFTTTTTTTLQTTITTIEDEVDDLTTIFDLDDLTTNEPVNLVTSTVSTTTISTTSTTSSTSTTTTTTSSYEAKNEPQFQDCPKFELQVGEYKMMEEEHSVYVEKYDHIYTEGEFSMNGDNLVICVTPDDSVLEYKFGAIMGYVTFIGLGLSILCLTLHIIASMIAPELQNLSGKNLFSLSLALLGGYSSFLATMFSQNIQGSLNCQILAHVMYYFFMASFFWMLLIAFDVCRTLKIATTQLRLTTGSQWRKFAIYSTLGWGLPLACTTVVTLMDHMEGIPQDYQPGFGTTQICWFSRKMALLIYFAVPFAGIMGANIFLFVFSACMVFDTTQSTAKMTTTCGPKTNFYLYMRLAIIMGLTWIIGLAAGFVDKQALWYIFVVLNTLQGMFIFGAFTCTRKVFESLRECCKRQDPSHRSTWRLSKESQMTSQNTTKKSTVDMSPASNNSDSPSLIPSRYGSRSKTMYTVSKQQVSGVTQNSFNGRYY